MSDEHPGTQNSRVEFARPATGKICKWFDEFLPDAWDRQIENDVLAGRLDSAGDLAIERFEAGRCEPL